MISGARRKIPFMLANSILFPINEDIDEVHSNTYAKLRSLSTSSSVIVHLGHYFWDGVKGM